MSAPPGSDSATRAARPLHGIVARAGGGTYRVWLETGEQVEATLRGRLKLEQRTGDRVTAGDRVAIQHGADGAATIEEVEERESELARRAPGAGTRRAKIIVANVEQVVVVLAAARPEANLRMLDRFLVVAESNYLPAVIVVNKTDLVPPGAVEARFAAYAAAGYAVLPTSAGTGEGVAALRDLVCGHTSVFTGPSGVGKSTLLNEIEPGLSLRTAAVSEAVGKGQHTTVAAELIPLACGGWVADTPGLRELGLWGVPAEDVERCFPEMEPYLGRCRFASCSHTHEPECAVREAVEAGEIDAARYRSYADLRAEMVEAARRG